MATWTKKKLKDITTKIGSGATPRGGQGAYHQEGMPLIRSLNVYDLAFSCDDLAFIDKSQAEQLANVTVEKNDVLLNITGASVCRCTSVPDNLVPARVNQHVSIIRADKKNLIGKYLKYILVSPLYKRALYGLATTGATREALTKNNIENFEIKLPNIDVQIRIASVLSAYDDLIENNEKRIKVLEEMARRLYAEWFVKLNFPGYEKVKTINSGTRYGMIPEGWEVKKLGDVSSIVRGCSYSSEEIDDFIGDFYIVNLKSFNRGGGFRFDGAKYYSGSINDNQSLKPGDVVVAVTDMTNDRAVIARPARVPEIDCKITFSADVVKINSDILPRSFIYQLLSSYRFTETTKQKANGANVLHLKPTAILEFVALIPDEQILNKFDVLCEPVVREIDKTLKQNDILSKTRDLLIPQLVTGKRELK